MKTKNVPESKVISAAEATIKLAIWDGMTDSWGNRDEQSSPKELREKIFQSLFESENRWAIEAHLQSLK